MQDDLLDHLVGSWKLEGTLLGRPAHHRLDAEWVLRHQFLRVHQDGSPDYDALVFIGFDNASERYVVHWLDIFGGRVSETLGYGTRAGNTIHFVFEYPDGPFHNTFIWKPDTGTWQMVLETKDKQGKWTNFATEDLTRVR